MNHKEDDSQMHNEMQNILDGIRKLVRYLRRSSKMVEKEVGLSVAQLFVLQKIGESTRSLSINEVAERTLTHQSSVSVVVSKLVKQGLIDRTPSKTDGRVAELSLTKKGESLLKRCPPVFQARLVEGITRMTSAERQGLVGGMTALIEKAGLDEEEPGMFLEEGKDE